jgi:hypothetical protein
MRFFSPTKETDEIKNSCQCAYKFGRDVHEFLEAEKSSEWVVGVGLTHQLSRHDEIVMSGKAHAEYALGSAGIVLEHDGFCKNICKVQCQYKGR